ncbi:holo-ACP synthase [Vibrio parahaemolyticus]|uniref:Holo-[acyl-carrier-protein] synthase n=9 Tax=Vibrionaceae TaxID=641 RepID=ACPS_VIBPA|nr:holo-ACP synthase [Vibrio parahaemolyticus]Q87LP3.1 RecName: Full=Holo-[acyl-carrier-protein] synthase; Short=Holo-ACP synthase; AltName: Full=4'-phosphopantetheinyl transferase AcpS [Vibrio parahaemolyticus RIMD 2210633]EFO34939.1 holo-[acyl-carrier-protein] synthase [Vibrio parahaemolyticus Peru-466]EFO50752.1 holo-[acyl-carrier-protein] synthase [Vibrio parahaemolyticus K5030]EVU14366.1 holo-[acyl-carrier-protein] synthase [Vibrio parahaemolyticus V-223/04]ARC19122.1 holo-ACP synthase [V
MAILGLGTDIAEIERIEKALGRSGEPFAQRILSEDEMAKFSQLKQQGRYLAKRFAAKEAASKALGTGIAQGVTFHDFTVSNDELGKPVLMLSGVAQKMAQTMGVNHVHLSISDERHYAVATVILES